MVKVGFVIGCLVMGLVLVGSVPAEPGAGQAPPATVTTMSTAESGAGEATPSTPSKPAPELNTTEVPVEQAVSPFTGSPGAGGAQAATTNGESKACHQLTSALQSLACQRTFATSGWTDSHCIKKGAE